MKKADSYRKYKIILFALYSIIVVILALRHEPWFDEARSWELAKILDFSNFQTIASSEGHPLLWHVFLIPFVRLGFPYKLCPLISTCVMIISAALLLFVPKDKGILIFIFRATLILSPVFIYLYSSIARSYCLCVLLSVLVTLFYEDRFEHPFRLCVSVALLIQTHVLVIGFCFGVCVVMLAEALLKLRKESKEGRKKYWEALFALCIPFFSALFYFVEFAYLFSNPILVNDDTKLDGIVFPLFFQMFSMFGTIGIYLLLLSVFLLAGVAVLTFMKSHVIHGKAALLVFILGCLGVGVVTHFYATQTRGYILIALFAMFMIYNNEFFEMKDLTPAIITACVIAFIAPAAGIWINHYELIVNDFSRPFSDAEKTAQIVNGLPEDATIYTFSVFPCQSIMPYLKTGVEIKTLDGYKITDAFSHYEEEMVERIGKESPTNFIKTDADEIYILYTQDTIKKYHDPKLLAAGHEYEIVYESDESVFYQFGLERFGLIKVDLSK